MNDIRLCWFSCGAPSAVAAKLTVMEYPDAEVVYCDTGGEHEDNKRFLKDVEKWLGKEVTILRSKIYKNHFEVAEIGGYINGPYGAKCTTELKRKLREAYQKPNHVHIWGFTVEERDRALSFEDHFPELKCEHPLIKQELTRKDCLALIARNKIKLPIMYKLGYKNNNCLGCWKGGKGYWNKIRVDFPDIFKEASRICNKLGRSPIKDNDGNPIMLDDLDPSEGNYKADQEIQCGIGCRLIDLEIKNSAM